MTLVFLRSGSIFDQRHLEVLVNPVNCRQTQGAGLAKKFAQHYPLQEQLYLKLLMRIGHPVMVESGLEAPHLITAQPGFLSASPRTDHQILLFPTKDDWRGRSRLEWIEQGLVNLIRDQKGQQYAGIAFPALGCGLGELKWPDVKTLFRNLSSDLEGIFGQVVVFEPQLKR